MGKKLVIVKTTKCITKGALNGLISVRAINWATWLHWTLLFAKALGVFAERIFWSIFSVWLSDLHIGRIIVLKGANPGRFENEPAALALSLATKARQKKSYCLRSSHYLHTVGSVWIISIKEDAETFRVVNRLCVMAPKPEKQRPADGDDDSGPVLFAWPVKQHCSIFWLSARLFIHHSFHRNLTRKLHKDLKSRLRGRPGQGSSHKKVATY